MNILEGLDKQIKFDPAELLSNVCRAGLKIPEPI